jgi:hypothetical protein
MAKFSQRLREMAFTVHVLNQKNLANPYNSCFAIAGRNFVGGIQINYILPPGRRVPIEKPICGSRPKYNPRRRKSF